MSDETLRDLVARMATDPAFADQVRSDPQATASTFGLTQDEVDRLGQLVPGADSAGPSMLDARLSKSALFFGAGIELDPQLAAGAPTLDSEPPSVDPVSFRCNGALDATTADKSSDPLAIQCNDYADKIALQCNEYDPVAIQCNDHDPVAIRCDAHEAKPGK